MERAFIISFSIILLSVNSSIAQLPITFEKHYGWFHDDYAEDIQPTDDGGYIVVGSTHKADIGYSYWNVYLLKLDSMGNKLWDKPIGGTTERGYSVRQTTDGGYIIAGFTTFYGIGRMYLARTDFLGDTVWTKSYTGDNFASGNSVQQCYDGGFVIAGFTNSSGPNKAQVYLVKTNANGDSLWTRTYGDLFNDGGNHVEQTSDSGFVMVGSKDIDGSNDDVFVVKTDKYGDTLWTNSYGGLSDDFGRSIKPTADKGYIIVGETRSYGWGSSDVYLVKIDSVGKFLWKRLHGKYDTDIGFDVEPTDDGGYIIAARSNSFSEEYNSFIVKTDSQGDSLWTKHFTTNFCCNLGEGFGSIHITSDGGYIFADTKYIAPISGLDVHVVKMDSLGNVYNSTSVDDGSGSEAKLIVYPNPVSTVARVSFVTPNNGNYRINLRNLAGQLIETVFDKNVSVGQQIHLDIAVSNLAVGAYLIEIQGDNYRYFEKLILTK